VLADFDQDGIQDVAAADAHDRISRALARFLLADPG
jgi:hypothetical protein